MSLLYWTKYIEMAYVMLDIPPTHNDMAAYSFFFRIN